MFKRYEKIPATLRFTLHHVNLKRKVNSDFKLSFARGSFKGATELVHPDDKGLLKFEASYDTKCTLYLSKSDATTKPKKLKIVLHRFTDENTSKIYGKIVIDVSKYYGSSSVSYEELEMESGRSIAPVLAISIIVQQSGQSVTGQIDPNDKSFIDEDTERIPINDWDKTEIDPQGSSKKKGAAKKKLQKSKDESDMESSDTESEKPAPKHHHHHKAPKDDDSQSTDHESTTDEHSEHEAPKASPIPLKEVKPKAQDKKAESILDSDSERPTDSEDEKPKKKPKKKTPKEENEAAVAAAAAEAVHHKKEDHEAEAKPNEKAKPDTKPAPKEAKPAPKEAKPSKDDHEDEDSKAPTKDKKPMNNSTPVFKSSQAKGEGVEADLTPPPPTIAQLFTAVLAKPWRNIGDTVYLGTKERIPMPCAVFPIFAVLRHTNVFVPATVPKELFEKSMDTFFDLYKKAPISENYTSEQKFFTTMAIVLLVNQTKGQHGQTHSLYDFDLIRVDYFTKRLLPFMNDYARKIVSPYLTNFEILCNRYATARFEVDPLLQDFNEVLKAVNSYFKYPKGVNDYLITQFMHLLDIKMLNKILANPVRFVFSKAITWNSFLTAFTAFEKHELTLLRQAVWALVMAVNICRDEEGDQIRKDLCPTLDPKILVYLLKNYKPDEMMPTQIEWTDVAIKVGVPDVNGYMPLKPLDINFDLVKLEKNLKLESWNLVRIEPEELKSYPYLEQYLAVPQ